MEIEKNNRINSLFEFYQPLLTQKQNDYIQLYYGDDYSLGEIAEEFDVSRQAVYDNIRRTEHILSDYEDKLHLLANYLAKNRQMDALQQYASLHYSKDQQLLTLINNLENLEEK